MSIGSNIGKYLSKGVGIAALGVIAYDSHVMGKIQSDISAKSGDADACYDTFNNTQYLSKPSPTMSKIKDEIHHIEMQSNVRSFFNSAGGYLKGVLQTLVSNVIPLGLGAVALFGKGKWSKGSAIGLAAYGTMVFVKDILGFGHKNELNKPY